VREKKNGILRQRNWIKERREKRALLKKNLKGEKKGEMKRVALPFAIGVYGRGLSPRATQRFDVSDHWRGSGDSIKRGKIQETILEEGWSRLRTGGFLSPTGGGFRGKNWGKGEAADPAPTSEGDLQPRLLSRNEKKKEVKRLGGEKSQGGSRGMGRRKGEKRGE